MKMKKEINKTILSLYPNTFGVCYAIFDSPNELIDYGVGYVRPVNSKKSIKKVEKYIAFHKPDIVVVRGLNEPNSKQSKRNQKLINLICKKAKQQGLKVFQYTRGQIKEIFSQFETTSKYQISRRIIEWFPELESIGYPYRKEWMAEHHNVGVFDAISMALVHYYLNE